MIVPMYSSSEAVVALLSPACPGTEGVARGRSVVAFAHLPLSRDQTGLPFYRALEAHILAGLAQVTES